MTPEVETVALSELPAPVAATAAGPSTGGTNQRGTTQPDRKRSGGAAAASASNPSPFIILLLALIALAIFVLRALG